MKLSERLTNPLRSVILDKLAEGTESRIAPQLRVISAQLERLHGLALTVAGYAESIHMAPALLEANDRDLHGWVTRRWHDLRPIILDAYAHYEHGSSTHESQSPNSAAD